MKSSSTMANNNSPCLSHVWFPTILSRWTSSWTHNDTSSWVPSQPFPCHDERPWVLLTISNQITMELISADEHQPTYTCTSPQPLSNGWDEWIYPTILTVILVYWYTNKFGWYILVYNSSWLIYLDTYNCLQLLSWYITLVYQPLQWYIPWNISCWWIKIYQTDEPSTSSTSHGIHHSLTTIDHSCSPSIAISCHMFMNHISTINHNYYRLQ